MTQVALENGTMLTLCANLGAMVKIEQVGKTIDAKSEPLLHTLMCVYALLMGFDAHTKFTPEALQEMCTAEDWANLLRAYKDEMKTWTDKFRADTPAEAGDGAEQGED